MRRSFFPVSATVLGLALLLTLSTASPALADIVFQPQTISLGSAGTSAHVHTDLTYSDGYPWDVYIEIEGVPVANGTYFADDCGNLVYKCKLQDVKDLVPDNARTVTIDFYANSYHTTITVPITPVPGHDK